MCSWLKKRQATYPLHDNPKITIFCMIVCNTKRLKFFTITLDTILSLMPLGLSRLWSPMVVTILTHTKNRAEVMDCIKEHNYEGFMEWNS